MVTPPSRQHCHVYRQLLLDLSRLIADVREVMEAFLHLGMISELPRKSLPAIARAVDLPNDQVLHHCLTESPWSVTGLRKRRLDAILAIKWASHHVSY